MDHHPRASAPTAPHDGDGWATPGCGVGTPDLVGEAQRIVSSFVTAGTAAGSAEQLVAMRTMIEQLEASWLGGVAAFERAAGPAAEGAGSVAAWMRDACRIAPGEAQQRSRVAHAADHRLTVTGKAMREGVISWRHGAVIERAVRDLSPELAEQVEQLLQQPARELDPVLLRRVADELRYILDPESADKAAKKRYNRRGLNLAETLGGMISISGLLDPTSGATVMAAIDALVAPTRGSDDERSWAQRRVDALTEICRNTLDTTSLPTVGGEKPHVNVTVDLATLRKEPGCRPGQARWVGPLTAEQVRLFACDASVTRIVMDGPSQVLDVGRATRTVPAAIRRAVVARDHTCIAMGCHRPPEHCDVHHIVFWGDGGPTSLENSALLCRVHHSFVHIRGWSVVKLHDGSLTLVPFPVTPHETGRPPPG